MMISAVTLATMLLKAAMARSAGVPVDTPDGAVPVEMLRADYLVLTRDGPPMPVRLILRETHRFRLRDDRARGAG